MGKELNIITPSSAIDIFQCDKAEELISKIEAEARSIVPDLSTDKGRKAIASTARKVSTSKVALDNLGKDLVTGWKSKAKVVDAERKLIRDRLDALRDEVRQPLTDWEESEKARKQAEEDAALLLSDHTQALEENAMFNREREIARKEAEQAAREQARIEKEAAEKAEAERVAHEARIAKEAAERAEHEAAEEIKAAKEAAEQAERDRIAAEQRAILQAEQAERDKADAERRDKARIKQAEIDKKEAADRARQAEIDRQNEEKRKADAEQARLEADEKHVGNIRRQAKESLMKIVDESTAKRIVLAISKGDIENVTINY